MSVYNSIPHIDLINGLNISPIPLEFSQEMTTTKTLAGIEAKINSIIDFRNEAVSDSNVYTDAQIDTMTTSINTLTSALTTRINTLPNDITFMSAFKTVIENTIGDIAKFPIFGLSDDGYFTVDIATSWNEITFDSDVEGHLLLNY